MAVQDVPTNGHGDADYAAAPIIVSTPLLTITEPITLEVPDTAAGFEGDLERERLSDPRRTLELGTAPSSTRTGTPDHIDPATRSALPGLMGAAEVAEALSVSASNLQFIKDLPEPVASVRATRLWLAGDVRAFVEVYQRRRRERAARSQLRISDRRAPKATHADVHTDPDH